MTISDITPVNTGPPAVPYFTTPRRSAYDTLDVNDHLVHDGGSIGAGDRWYYGIMLTNFGAGAGTVECTLTFSFPDGTTKTYVFATSGSVNIPVFIPFNPVLFVPGTTTVKWQLAGVSAAKMATHFWY